VTRAAVWRELRPFVPLVAILAVYSLVHLVIGAIHEHSFVVAIVLLVFRFVAIAIVPFNTVYRLVMRFLRRWTDAGVRSNDDHKMGDARDVSRRV
jgi:hypothetical protein